MVLRITPHAISFCIIKNQAWLINIATSFGMPHLRKMAKFTTDPIIGIPKPNNALKVYLFKMGHSIPLASTPLNI
jgi:hypothetical protein